MSDKVYGLVEKMYIEFSGKFQKIDQRFDRMDQRFDNMDQRFDNMDQRFDKMDQRFDRMDQRMIRLEMKIENEVMEKIDFLYDGHVEIKESLAIINTKLNKLAAVDENHELRIRVIESGHKNMTV